MALRHHPLLDFAGLLRVLGLQDLLVVLLLLLKIQLLLLLGRIVSLGLPDRSHFVR